ncbi:MAG: hypothetical protein WAP17_08360 [Bacteroidales bacterium]|jgi:hypothetical protein|nr:hypothetical protein [Bacteroidales bacterium]
MKVSEHSKAFLSFCHIDISSTVKPNFSNIFAQSKVIYDPSIIIGVQGKQQGHCSKAPGVQQTP